MATQFLTPRGAARRIGTPPVLLKTEDHRFASPRGSARSFSDDSAFATPRFEPTSYSSDEETPPPPPSTLPSGSAVSYYKDIAFAKLQPTLPIQQAPPPVDVFSLARHNRVEEVKTALDNGLPVNIVDAYGNSLLIIACQNGLKRLAKELLRRGANINARNHRGNTPLHFCFAYGYGDSLGAYLISKGADVTLRNADGLECYYGIEPPTFHS
ncbi:hypothetical protein LEN26_013506 [Aphanomyces euteiches]|nr:hypothetical protein AeMF1_021558 [Aphanomyces euteiches]KAH9111301.1 hypothetical protein LEN26_013506 [Aphanomyces euteiches]KAH9190363.1 hypothetical protein AeNC1_007668 [Aphanomyces euteiches]